MGNSFVTFRKKHVNARDFKFEVWLFLLARLISELNEAPEWLRNAGGEWLQLARVLPNGCIDPELDEYLTDDERVGLFVKLCDAGLERLRCFGPSVPASFLNELCESGSEGGFQKDLELSVLFEFGRALKCLVLGEQSEEMVRA